MRSPIRAFTWTAFAAFALVAIPHPAHAQSATGEAGRSEPPTLLGASVGAGDGTLAARRSAASPIVLFEVADQPVVRLPEVDSSEAIPVPVPIDPKAGEGRRAPDSVKPSVKGRFGPIDQYPQNPRCYVAGQYIPAPPTCPN